MEKQEQALTAAVILIGAIIVLNNVVVPIVNVTSNSLTNLHNHRKLNKRIKRGMKEGEILKSKKQFTIENFEEA